MYILSVQHWGNTSDEYIRYSMHVHVPSYNASVSLSDFPGCLGKYAHRLGNFGVLGFKSHELTAGYNRCRKTQLARYTSVEPLTFRILDSFITR